MFFQHYGLIDARDVNTTPGANSVLAPPSGFNGSDDEYKAYLREIYLDPGAFQQLVLAAINVRVRQYAITGPYAQPAREALRGIESRFVEQAA